MSATDLSTITELGTIDAETDFRPDFFVPSTSWASIRTRERPIATGRKGTGKTALRLALRDLAGKDAEVFVTALTFRDYPWAVHNKVFDASVGGRSRYQETWIFLLLVELSKLVVGENQAPPRTQDESEIHEAIRKFLLESWGGITFDHRDTFRSKRFKITKASFAPTVVGTSLGSVDWTTVERDALGEVLTGMNRWLRAALEVLIQDRPHEYFLVFDELDLDFASQDETYLDSMIGLLLAAQNVFLWAKESELPVGPVVLMRDDIYGNLSFPDKNKITMNLVELIQWNSEFAGPNALKGVIDKRIQILLDEESADPWNLLFDEDVMRGTQHKYLHIAQRSYLRPRDMIHFVNQCIKEARNRGRLVDGTRIANEDVTRARTDYSNYLRSELADEIHAHHPTWESWLEVLRRIGSLTFPRAGFDEECERSKKLTEGHEPAEILEAFYRFGIIGFARRGGAGRGGTEEYWSYRDPGVTFDAEAPYFKVHPGLKENLDLKEGR